jgi:ferredoxin--NADP+ reductase
MPPATDSHPTDPGPALREAVMHLATPASPITATVVSTRRCTASPKSASFVRHIAFDIAGTPLENTFLSGQSFGVLPPGLDAAGKPHKLRLYSLASPTGGEDGSGKVVATTVKRTIDEDRVSGKLFLGVCSNYLCDLAPGEKVRMTGPNGKRFVLPANPQQHAYTFFATGTGIAPFRGMVLDLLRAGVKNPVTLVMGVPYAADLLYDEDLRSLAQRHPNFKYVTALSRQAQPGGGAPMYVHQRLAREGSRESEDVLASIMHPGGLVYVCGVAGMELGVLQQIARVLPEGARERYLHAPRETMQQIDGWTRTMIHKEVRPTRRVFLEVY